MNHIMKNIGRCAGAIAAGLALASAASAATVNVDSSITTSQIWTRDNVYVLTNVTYVSNGATLTIQPGTVVRGEPPTSPGSGDPGALVIARGSKIFAVGRPDLPIVFTDLNDDNVPGQTPAGAYGSFQKLTGQWGGVIALGRTYIAFNTGTGGPDPARDNQVEGVTANGTLGRYGGNDDDDDTGAMSYISIRYGGAGLVANNEINGLTLGGVGRSTHVSHIEIMNNIDDGLEQFGGTVNVRNVAMLALGDDGYDTDEGYRGNIQFVANFQGDCGGSAVGSGISDRGFESDGGNNPDASQPYALWAAYNVTIVGKGQDDGTISNVQAKYTKQDENIGIVIRDNCGLQVYNSLVMDTGGPALLISAEGTGINSKQRYETVFNDWAFHNNTLSGLAASDFYTQQSADYQAHVADNVFWQHGDRLVDPDGAAGGFPLAAVSSNEVHIVRGDTAFNAVDGPNPFVENLRGAFLGTNWNNRTTASMPIAGLTRESAAAVAEAKMLNIVTIDPRPVAAEALAADRTPVADGFFTPVSFKGAFGPNVNWMKGWTVMDSLGMITSPAATLPVATYSFTSTDVTLTWTGAAAGSIYVVEGSLDGIRWTPIAGSVRTGVGPHTFTESLDPVMQYKIVAY
jgi:hypothetical protein